MCYYIYKRSPQKFGFATAMSGSLPSTSAARRTSTSRKRRRYSLILMQPPVSCQPRSPQTLIYTGICSIVGAISWGPPKGFGSWPRKFPSVGYQVDSVHASEWSSKHVELYLLYISTAKKIQRKVSATIM